MTSSAGPPPKKFIWKLYFKCVELYAKAKRPWLAMASPLWLKVQARNRNLMGYQETGELREEMTLRERAVIPAKDEGVEGACIMIGQR